MASKFVFNKASKAQSRARVSFAGPSGSGKTYGALMFARALVGPAGRILVIDTERGSASLYADRFDFDTYDFAPPFDPRTLVDVLASAAHEKYDVVVVDSLSHFWSSEGGLLDFVDANGGSFQKGWRAATPVQNRMVDSLLAYPGHVIVTMRAKTEYVIEKVNGKDTPVKVGLAPVQRDGIEYEFTLAFDVDYEHALHVSKSRCPELATIGVFPATGVQRAADTFLGWLTSGDAPTLDALVAKRRLMAELASAGHTDVAQAKALALSMWQDAGFGDGRVDMGEYEAMLAGIVPAVPVVDDGGWSIDDTPDGGVADA